MLLFVFLFFLFFFENRACRFGHLKIIKILLEESRSPNILINLPRNNGVTPLLMSIKFEHVEIVRYLVRDDDDDDDDDDEENDAQEMKRRRRRRKNILKNLNVNQTQLSGQSPLHAA